MEVSIENANIENKNIENTNAGNANSEDGVGGTDKLSNVDMYRFISSSLIKAGMSLDKQDICSYSPLTLAYIGDGIYELIIRSMIVTEGNGPVNKMHKRSSSLVKAETQAEFIKYMLDNDILNDEELRIYKRGRNAQSYTKAKNASVTDYRMATGFEALIGYLYLSGQSERMMELVGSCLRQRL